VAAATSGHALRLWNIETGERLKTGDGCDRPGDVATDALRVVCRQGDKLVLTDVVAGSAVARFDAELDGLELVSLSPAGDRLAGFGGWGFFRPSLAVWSTSTGRREELAGWGPGRVLAVAWRPDGRELAVAGDGRSVSIWSFETGAVRETIEGLPALATALAFAADGNELAIACEDRSVRIWERDTGRLVPVRGERSRIDHLSFSSDGRVLAGVASDRVLLIDTKSRRLARTLADPDTGVNHACFNWQSSAIAVATNSGRIDVWSLPNDLKIAPAPPRRLTVGPPGGRIWMSQFTPDGRHLTCWNGNGTLFVLRLAEYSSGSPLSVQR
jgi:WD40 repeat protein